MNLILATLKSKGLSILCIVLATLLTISYLSGKADQAELIQVRGKLLEHVSLNERLSKQNLTLAEEVRTKPTQYIPIVKEVSKEVCNGVVRQQLINALPPTVSKKEIDNGNTTQSTTRNTANIDDQLPTSLIQLLK